MRTWTFFAPLSLISFANFFNVVPLTIESSIITTSLFLTTPSTVLNFVPDLLMSYQHKIGRAHV